MDRLRLLTGSRHWLLLAALAFISLALGTAIFSGASFTSKSANNASLAAGSVQLSSSAPNQAIVSAAGMKPGESREGTISIGNQGDVAGSVTLKANGLTGMALAAVVVLKIEDVTGGATKEYEGKFGSFSSVDLGSFDAATTRKYRFVLSWPEASSEASLQGASTSLALQWEVAHGFTDTSSNPQTVSAVADWTAPTAEASAIAKSQGGTAGYVKEKGTYYVYAKVAESGNPPSGVASVKANVSAITSGQPAVSLVAGSYTAGGVSYDYRSAQLTASSGLTAGAKSYSLALADNAGNSRTQTFSTTVDNGPFAGSSFSAANGGGTGGKPEQGDSVTFGYSKAPEPGSILAEWSGVASASVSVTITQSSSNDSLSVPGTNLGTVALKGNYVSKTTTFSNSSMVLSGNSVTITLGSPGLSSALEEKTKRAPVWTPSSSVYDRADNACSTANVTAVNERQF